MGCGVSTVIKYNQNEYINIKDKYGNEFMYFPYTKDIYEKGSLKYMGKFKLPNF